MARVTTLIIIILCLTTIERAAAGTLYKCTGPDGIPSYVTKEREGETCVVLSKYTPKAVESPSTAGPGGSWTLAGAGAGFEMYYKRAAGSGLAAWVMTSHHESKAYDPKTYSPAHRSSIARWKIDCKEGRSGAVQQVFYAEPFGAGVVIDRRQVEGEPSMSYAIPDTMAEVIINGICTSGKGP